MDHQSVVCQKCTGVLLATDSRTYTARRGRLIVSNGYCTCPAETEAPAEQTAHRHQQPQQTEQAAHRQQQHAPVSHQQQNAQPAGHNSMVIV